MLKVSKIMAKTQAYGTWSSPITPRMIADSLPLDDAQWDSDGETLVWQERRSTGSALVAQRGNDAPYDLTDSHTTVGGRVGYGGGGFTVHDGNVYFVSKGRLQKLSLDGGMPQAITPKFGGTAAPSVSPDGRWVAFVHTYEDTDGIAIVDTDGKQWPQKLCYGDDFAMQPTWHPKGQYLAYVAWNHPQMPWNGCELCLIRLQYDTRQTPFMTEKKVIAGDTETAVFQPQFSPDGKYLAYASDASDFWNLYLYDLETGEHQQISHEKADYATPAWIQGLRTFAWTADSSAIYALRNEKGFYSTVSYDLEHQTWLPIHELEDYKHHEQISVSAKNEQIALIGSSPTISKRLLTYSAESGVRVLRRSTGERLSEAYLSEAQAITWEGHDNEPVHGLYFAPKNPNFEGIGEPPLMVLVHGGPTSQRVATFDLKVQFFTSRGYAVLQVNHRGSTGYGKAYMNKHAGNWGVYDVQDSVTGAQYLVRQKLANPDKLVIMGGSAGGYTVLQALVDVPGFFKAGVCSYGISNQFALVQDTHKFEARYNDWLLGTLPEAAALYRDRSPLFHAEKIKDAVIVFQGEDDNVVPKNQSDMIVAQLRRNGVPHEYHVYEGEGHGWRKPETKLDFYNKTLAFLQQYVIFV